MMPIAKSQFQVGQPDQDDTVAPAEGEEAVDLLKAELAEAETDGLEHLDLLLARGDLALAEGRDALAKMQAFLAQSAG